MNNATHSDRQQNFLDLLLYKWGIKKDLAMELPIDRLAYLNYLDSVSYYDRSLDFGTDVMDVFKPNYREFKGVLYDHHFELKRKRRIFDFGLFYAKSKGSILEQGSHISVHITVNSFRTVFYIFFGILIPTYGLFIILILFTALFEDPTAIIGLFFILLHGSLVLLVPILLLKRSTNYLSAFFMNQKYFLK